jgi:hypothetical protein
MFSAKVPLFRPALDLVSIRDTLLKLSSSHTPGKRIVFVAAALFDIAAILAKGFRLETDQELLSLLPLPDALSRFTSTFSTYGLSPPQTLLDKPIDTVKKLIFTTNLVLKTCDLRSLNALCVFSSTSESMVLNAAPAAALKKFSGSNVHPVPSVAETILSFGKQQLEDGSLHGSTTLPPPLPDTANDFLESLPNYNDPGYNLIGLLRFSDLDDLSVLRIDPGNVLYFALPRLIEKVFSTDLRLPVTSSELTLSPDFIPRFSAYGHATNGFMVPAFVWEYGLPNLSASDFSTNHPLLGTPGFESLYTHSPALTQWVSDMLLEEPEPGIGLWRDFNECGKVELDVSLRSDDPEQIFKYLAPEVWKTPPQGGSLD